MRRSSEEELLSATELECLRSLEELDEQACKDRHSQSQLRSANSASHLPGEGECETDFWVDSSPEMRVLKDRLSRLESSSRSVVGVSESLREFEDSFRHVQQSSAALAQAVQKIQGDAAGVLEKQHRLVDLSVNLQETLDYYNYINKFRFEFPCELAQRELFEDQLQVVLSQLT